MRWTLLLLLVGAVLVGGCGGAGSEALDAGGRDTRPGDADQPDVLPDGTPGQDAFDTKPQGDLPGDGLLPQDGQTQADGDLSGALDLLPDPDLYPVLCQPCRTDADCKVEGAAGERCLTYGDTGSFCGTLCDDTDACPKGFACEPRQDGQGVQTNQCVALAQCPCNAASVAQGLYTFCYFENDLGRCKGVRTCADGGLSACDAREAKVETCNGLDDDCDGGTDDNACDDANPCTADSCDKGQCSNVPDDELGCDDGSACTQGDHCAGGACVFASQKDCDDGKDCTVDSCAPDGTCVNVLDGDNPDCGCNAASLCSDLDPCTRDWCDLASTRCQHEPLSCDDHNPCTADSCDSEVEGDACRHTLTLDAPGCEAKDLCDANEDCVAANKCQTATCVIASGEAFGFCEFKEKVCNDKSVCTKDSCNLTTGLCEYATLKCVDDNPCTSDYCDPGLGCIHDATTGKCNDGNACTDGDVCQDGGCKAGALVVCDDKNDCTADYCDPAKGCTFLPVALPCDDGDPCTQGDTCDDGACVGGSPRVCDDKNPCTNDECLEGIGCSSVPAGNTCSDGNPCTTGDHCDSGFCVAGTPPKLQRQQPLHGRRLRPQPGLHASEQHRPVRRRQQVHHRGPVQQRLVPGCGGEGLQRRHHLHHRFVRRQGGLQEPVLAKPLRRQQPLHGRYV